MKLDEIKVGKPFIIVASDGVTRKCPECANNVFVRGGILGDATAVFFGCECGMKFKPSDIPAGATLFPTAKSAGDSESLRREAARLNVECLRKHKALLDVASALRNILADIEEACNL